MLLRIFTKMYVSLGKMIEMCVDIEKQLKLLKFFLLCQSPGQKNYLDYLKNDLYGVYHCSFLSLLIGFGKFFLKLILRNFNFAQNLNRETIFEVNDIINKIIIISLKKTTRASYRANGAYVHKVYINSISAGVSSNNHTFLEAI